jgi:hypothetical protein
VSQVCRSEAEKRSYQDLVSEIQRVAMGNGQLLLQKTRASVESEKYFDNDDGA